MDVKRSTHHQSPSSDHLLRWTSPDWSTFNLMKSEKQGHYFKDKMLRNSNRASSFSNSRLMMIKLCMFLYFTFNYLCFFTFLFTLWYVLLTFFMNSLYNKIKENVDEATLDDEWNIITVSVTQYYYYVVLLFVLLSKCLGSKH